MTDSTGSASAKLRELAKEAEAIYNGFVNESLNGVVCSIPDEGIEMRPHRTWCARCQRRYQRLRELAKSLRALRAVDVPTPAQLSEWREALAIAIDVLKLVQDGDVVGREAYITAAIHGGEAALRADVAETVPPREPQNSMELQARILKAIASADVHEELWWRYDDGAARFFVGCNDFFAWGTADAEEITAENIRVLEQSLQESEEWGTRLFCARVRGIRPQGAAYPEDPAAWPMFDACGPERVVGFLNPQEHPSLRAASPRAASRQEQKA